MNGDPSCKSLLSGDSQPAAGEDSFFLSLADAARQAGADTSWKEDHEEGQLSVDVLETDSDLIVVATMAGTRPEDIELHLHNDCLTIRGERHPPSDAAQNYFYQECYWGRFSRTIVLPAEVKSELVRSEYRWGVLVVHLPKAAATATIPLMVVEE